MTGTDERQSDHQISLENVLSHFGRRSFGPVLLLVGLITMIALIGDIPGVPTLKRCSPQML